MSYYTLFLSGWIILVNMHGYVYSFSLLRSFMDHDDPRSPHNFSGNKEMPPPKNGISPNSAIHHLGKIPIQRRLLKKKWFKHVQTYPYILRRSDPSERFLPHKEPSTFEETSNMFWLNDIDVLQHGFNSTITYSGIRRPLCLAWGGGAREARSSALVAKSSMTEPHLCPARAWFVHPWHFLYIPSMYPKLGNGLHFCLCPGEVAARFLPTYLPPPAVLYLCFLSRFRSCSFGSVWKGCERTVFGLPELGFRWCLAFSDPLPTSFIFVSVQVRLLTCYGPLPVSFNGFEAAVSAACTVLYLCLLTVSKLQFRQRVEGLRTHCFWLAWARI